MRKRRIYHILCLFSEGELRELRDFLVSPLFNGSKMLQRFFMLWEERMLGPDRKDLDAEAFLEGSGFQVARLDKLCSQLLKRCLEFIAFREYLNSETQQYHHTSQGLIRREASEDEIRRQEDRFRKYLVKRSDSAETLLERMQLEWREVEAKIKVRQTRALYKQDFKNLHDALDTYYFLQKLKIACATANARLMYQQDQNPASAFLDFFRQEIAVEDMVPLIQCYFHNIEMLTQPDDQKHFQQLLNLLQQHSGEFEPDDARELYNYAINFTIRKGNQGELVYREYTGALYKDLLAKGFLLIEGKLPPQTLKNIIILHCMLGELDWVEEFIEEYRNRLPEGTDPALVTYNEGVLAFFRKNYAQAIRQLKEVISLLKDDIFYEIDARALLWKSYFENFEHLSLEEVDEMERMYDAFRVFIDRNTKLSEIHKRRYRNFIREFKRLQVMLQQSPLSLEQLQEFKEEVESLEYTYNKDWFLVKANDLIEKALSRSAK